LETALNSVTIVLSVVLVGMVLLQVKGSGGGLFGQAYSSNFRSRRGFEQTLFRGTIFLTVVFVILALVSARFIDRG
jgi:protein translocase SecG subunit